MHLTFITIGPQRPPHLGHRKSVDKAARTHESSLSRPQVSRYRSESECQCCFIPKSLFFFYSTHTSNKKHSIKNGYKLYVYLPYSVIEVIFIAMLFRV